MKTTSTKMAVTALELLATDTPFFTLQEMEIEVRRRMNAPRYYDQQWFMIQEGVAEHTPVSSMEEIPGLSREYPEAVFYVRVTREAVPDSSLDGSVGGLSLP